jgi:hypothetical protein
MAHCVAPSHVSENLGERLSVSPAYCTQHSCCTVASYLLARPRATSSLLPPSSPHRPSQEKKDYSSGLGNGVWKSWDGTVRVC